MRIIGIDLGTWSIKAVELESRFRRMELLDFHEIRLPLQNSDPSTSYRQGIDQLMARLPVLPEKVITGLPPSHTALRFLQFPIKQRKQVEKTFRFELEDNIPFKMEDAIVEHQYWRTKAGSLVFATIAPKKNVLSHVEFLKRVGLDPDWLTFDGMGLANIYLSQQADIKPEAEITTALVNLGHTKTTIAVFEGARLQFFRTVSWGGNSINQALAVSSAISIEEAEQLKLSSLRLDEEIEAMDPNHQDVALTSMQAISPLVTDLNHTFVSYRNLYQNQIQAVLVTGGTSKIPGLEKFLQRQLNAPVTSFPAFQDLSIKEGSAKFEETRFGEAVGSAFVFARKASILFNFRQQEAGKETSIAEISSFLQDANVVLLAKFGLFLLGVLFLHVTVSGIVAGRETKLAQDDLGKVLAQTFPSLPQQMRKSLSKSPADLGRYVDQKTKDLDQRLNTALKNRTPMLSLIRDVSNAFSDSVKVDVNTLQLDDKTFTVEGVVYSGDVNQVVEALKKISAFGKIDVTMNTQRFTIKGEVIGR